MYSIVVENLIKKYNHFVAVDNISFKVKRGEIFGFLGANGAGKTTTIKMLCGLLQPTSGNATVAGYDLKKDYKSIKKNIGYMSQRFSLYEDLTLYENMQLFGTVYGIQRKILK
jgi:ABC-2 type transport system ATP-binding protein